jgi:hypothetical protein
VRRFSLFGVFLVIGLLYWAWDVTHHDHGGPHGTPMTVTEIQRVAVGAFTTDDGESHSIQQATCKPGEDGKGEEPNTHFRCDVWFSNGMSDNVVIHVLPDELMFKTAES